MLPQNFQRKDAEWHRRKPRKLYSKIFAFDHKSRFFLATLQLCVFALISLSFSCGSKPTDVRTLIPSDALVYLETKDLGKAVGTVINNKTLQEAIRSVPPDTIILNGMQMSVAVTGFETREQAVTEESSVLSFQPRFVAILETNKWNFQVLTFAEERLGLFISEAYGGEATLESSDKLGGKYYIWSGQDGRKAYGLVIGSLIYFGNDESSIERCLAIGRGEEESIAKNPKITNGERLAFGYVSPDGIAQISNIIGISLAKQSSEEGDVQSFIARVLPELLRGSVKDATWAAEKSDDGIEDKYLIELDPDLARIGRETMADNPRANDLAEFVPIESVSATRYNFKDPRLAWRSVLLSASSSVSGLDSSIVTAFSGSLFEPYGIEDPELFLGAMDAQIITVRFDEVGDSSVAFGKSKNLEQSKRSLSKEIDFSKSPERVFNADIWRAEDGTAFAIAPENIILAGDAEAIRKCLEVRQNGANIKNSGSFKTFDTNNSPFVTIGFDAEIKKQIANVVGDLKEGSLATKINYTTQTSFVANKLHRSTRSEFGLIGTIISHLSNE